MKKAILLILILSVSFITKVNSQNLKKDCEFYKATTHLLTAINSFNEVNEGNLEKENAILNIEKNLNVINSVFETLKEKYKLDEDFKEYEGWVSGIIKSLEFMKKDEPTYVLMCYLLKLQIIDFVNQKY